MRETDHSLAHPNLDEAPVSIDRDNNQPPLGQHRQGETAVRIGVDLGGHKINVGAVVDGTVTSSAQEPTPSSRTPDTVIRAIVRLVRSLNIDELLSVGIGLPGMLSLDRRSVVRLTNLPRWDNLPLAHLLEDRLKVPVVLDNDAKCAALGELVAGEGQGMTDFVMITLGTGIGGAVVSGGSVLRGRRGLAGELGHLGLLHQEPCNCGGMGHSETLFSADRFDRRCVETGVQSVPALWKKRKEPRHRLFWDRSLEALACTVISAVHLLDPQAIVFSGGLARLPNLMDELAPLVEVRLATAFRPGPPLLLSQLGGDGPVIGAASLLPIREETGRG
ncbi:MAG: glucokinase [Dethiosulfovibrio peptidovorans]|nr:MAG: glucokinase [Dethiosulfovibrio peptidovorans]